MRSDLSKIILLFILCTGVLFFPASYSKGAHASARIRIGIPEEPKTFNISLASDAWSKKVLFLIYEPLYIRDPNTLKLVPWLTEKEPVKDLLFLLKADPDCCRA